MVSGIIMIRFSSYLTNILFYFICRDLLRWFSWLCNCHRRYAHSFIRHWIRALSSRHFLLRTHFWAGIDSDPARFTSWTEGFVTEGFVTFVIGQPHVKVSVCEVASILKIGLFLYFLPFDDQAKPHIRPRRFFLGVWWSSVPHLGPAYDPLRRFKSVGFCYSMYFFWRLTNWLQ